MLPLLLTQLVLAADGWPPITDAVDVAALEVNAAWEGCYLDRAGAVKCWGGPFAANRIGAGRTEPLPGPIAVPELRGAIAFGRHMGVEVCVIGRARKVQCLYAKKPRDAGGATQFEGNVSMNGCARLQDGRVSCWGSNYGCALGPRADAKKCESSPSFPPARVPGVDHAVWVATASAAACAVRDDGGTVCWGRHPFRVPADDPTAAPMRIPSLPPLNRIELLMSGAIGIDREGKLRLWKRPSANEPAVPAALPGAEELPQVKDVAVGLDYAVIVGADGSAWLAGEGPLDMRAGNHARRSWSDPVQQLPGITDAVKASAGTNHACLLTRGGQIRCFGSNGFGQLGDGTLADRFEQPSTVVAFLPDKLPEPMICAASVELRQSCLRAGPECELKPSPLLFEPWCRGATPPRDWKPPQPPPTTPCLCTCSEQYRKEAAEQEAKYRHCSMLP